MDEYAQRNAAAAAQMLRAGRAQNGAALGLGQQMPQAFAHPTHSNRRLALDMAVRCNPQHAGQIIEWARAIEAYLDGK